MNFKKIILLSYFIIALMQLQANENFEDFMKEIQNTTKIATKNNIETTYAPGIITILKSEDLKRMGIKNFYEALRLIPSVDIGLSSTGTRNIITRGVGGITGSGKTKIMINGVGQNSNASGIIHFNLPIDVIERIEVIRGPASALYGEYAFSGVINIVTKKDVNSVFYLRESNSNLIGTTLNYNENDLKIDASLIVDDDKGFESSAIDSNLTTKDIETLRKEQDFITQISYKDFKANFSLNKVKKGEFYGAASLLPENDNDDNFVYDYKTIELSNKFNINENYFITPRVGILSYKYNFYFSKMAPYTIPFPPPFGVRHDDKVKGKAKYNKKYIMLDSIYLSKNYEIVAGIEKSITKETKSYSSSYNQSNGQTTIEDSNESQLNKRDVKSFYIHDNIKVTNKLGINLGVRYEKYNDKLNKKLSNSTLPRIASVYRHNDNNTFKLQYGKAYRPPTFLEGVAVKPEKIATYEFQHIYKNSYHQIQTTLFYSTIMDLIIKDGPRSWTNKTEDIVSKGIELELLHNFNNEYLFNSNITYSDVYEKQSKQDIGKYSNILANFNLSYMPYSKFSSNIHIRYIGSKKREQNDIRNKFKSQYTTDISFKYLRHKNNLEILFGIKDIFNKSIKVPSSKATQRGYTIEDDYIYEQRNYFIEVNYKF